MLCAKRGGLSVVMAVADTTMTGGNLASMVEVQIYNWQLEGSAVGAKNAAFDRLFKQYDDKMLQDAGKVNAQKF